MDFYSKIRKSIYCKKNNLYTYILQYYHDYILIGHFRQNKILKLICYDYTWPFLCMNVKNLCNSCVTYIKFKPQYHKPYKTLKKLSIFEYPWNSISIDFIKKLLSLSDCNTILVIINWLSKQAIFIPIVDIITLHELAKLFVIHVFSKYSILFHVIFDHKTEFVLNFFRFLGIALDMKLYFTSGYYPKEDSQTKSTRH